jgi:hypothetical protein
MDARHNLPDLVRDFDGIQIYCMFIGHPRSGHSLFGSLLDAHPEIVVAHEFNALKFIQRNTDRNELFYRLWRRSKQFTRHGRRWNGYKYKVPNQWHGRYKHLKVIGDKKGGSSTDALKSNPDLLNQLRQIVVVPVKTLHVIRNPFDNIRTVSRYYHRNRLLPAITGYFSRCAVIKQIKQTMIPGDWLDVYHEDVVADPNKALKIACQFLGLATTVDYLNDCASIVFDEPRKRRFEINWSHDQRKLVEDNIGQFDWLSRYSYDH